MFVRLFEVSIVFFNDCILLLFVISPFAAIVISLSLIKLILFVKSPVFSVKFPLFSIVPLVVKLLSPTSIDELPDDRILEFESKEIPLALELIVRIFAFDCNVPASFAVFSSSVNKS